MNFDDEMFNRSNRNNKLFNEYGTDVNKILISKKEPYGKKGHTLILYWI